CQLHASVSGGMPVAVAVSTTSSQLSRLIAVPPVGEVIEAETGGLTSIVTETLAEPGVPPGLVAGRGSVRGPTPWDLATTVQPDAGISSAPELLVQWPLAVVQLPPKTCPERVVDVSSKRCAPAAGWSITTSGAGSTHAPSTQTSVSGLQHVLPHLDDGGSQH